MNFKADVPDKFAEEPSASSGRQPISTALNTHEIHVSCGVWSEINWQLNLRTWKSCCDSNCPRWVSGEEFCNSSDSDIPIVLPFSYCNLKETSPTSRSLFTRGYHAAWSLGRRGGVEIGIGLDGFADLKIVGGEIIPWNGDGMARNVSVWWFRLSLELHSSAHNSIHRFPCQATGPPPNIPLLLIIYIYYFKKT